MKKKPEIKTLSRLSIVIAVVFLLLPIGNVKAVTHTVTFGGTAGLSYAPPMFLAHVGDTVEWVGDFLSHPLSSTTLPAGATGFHIANGSSFRYPIKVAGSYSYQCDYHSTLGMVGAFSATPLAVEVNPNPGMSNLQISGIFPGSAVASNVAILFRIGAAQIIKLAVYSVDGKKISLLVDGQKQAGTHIAVFPANLGSGVYLCRLTGAQSSDTKKVVISR